MSRRATGRILAAGVVAALPLSMVTLVTLALPDDCQPAVALTGDPSNTSGWDPRPAVARNQQENARTIVKVGLEQHVPPKGLAVAVAAAKVETQLLNLDYGDRDSLGLFQQRDAWGPAEARLDPATAAEMFYTGGKGGQPGLLDTKGWEAMPIGDAAQDVQVSAFPERYGQQSRFAVRVVNTLVEGGDASLVDDLPEGCDSTAPGVSADPTRYAATQCESTPQGPTGLRAKATVMREDIVNMSGITNIGGYSEGGHVSTSDHYTGCALDVMIPDWATGSGIAAGNRVADWAWANAKAYGVSYIIWRARIISTDRADEGWRPYVHEWGNSSPTLAHMDHVHISLD